MTTGTVDRLRESARKKKLRLTPQRELILRILGSAPEEHFTAHELFQRVRAEMPSVSQATVYRSAHTLVEAGVIGVLERPGGAAQYDVNLDDHHHFVCDRCGRVLDVGVSEIKWRLRPLSSRVAGLKVTRYRLQLHGLCARCRPRR